MSRVSVLIIYFAVAILLLLLLSHSPNKSSQAGRHRRLKLRSNFSSLGAAAPDKRRHEHVPFDPLVSDIEMRREDKEWEIKHFEHSHPEFTHPPSPEHESQPEWEDFMNAEDYLNDEDRFNVTGRLILLFPKLDVDPPDGYATQHELTEWILNNTEKEVLHRSQRELELHDKNKDGLISFAEYDPPTWARNPDSTSGNEMGWWKEGHFNASDADGDGFLNVTEYNDFLHPSDSNNQKLLLWLCKEEIRERDTDKDGKASFEEFFHGLFDILRNYDEEEEHSSSGENDDVRKSSARKLFAQLDKDADGYLSDLELLPVIRKLHPTERYYSKQQADYIISQADSDKDGRLSLTEMIDNPYAFYSAIFNEEDDEDYQYHDEFR